MYIVGFLGNYGGCSSSYDGQTIKTKIVSSEIEKQVGSTCIIKKNTHGGLLFLLKMPFMIFVLLFSCRNILIFPAQRGIKLIVPFLVIFNKFFRRKLHYVVIGGWLPFFIEKRPVLTKMLKKIDWIYVETEIMKSKMNEFGFQNVCVMPNFKELHILEKKELKYSHRPPYKFCTFSRVMKEKGIEDAVNAIVLLNEKMSSTICTLDIYGKVCESQKKWFESLMKNVPKEIAYKGCVSFDKSVEILKNYHALLFPTYYNGEGFAGTLLDAYAAGVPVIASEWHYNTELVENGKTGLICKIQNVNDLMEKVHYSVKHIDEWNECKKNCVDKANNYMPTKVINVLISRLG